jgi:hypothetical protein
VPSRRRRRRPAPSADARAVPAVAAVAAVEVGAAVAVGEVGETGQARRPDGPHPGTGYSGNGYFGTFTGRAAHQAPEVDGVTTVRSAVPLAPGDMVRAVVTGSDGVDLIADAIVPTGAIMPGRG